MDLLTPCINVPQERAKLRRLRDEIAAQVQARNEALRKLGVRGYRRLNELHNLHALGSEVRPGDGEAQIRPVRPSAEVDLYVSPARMWKPQAGAPARLCCTCEVDQRVTL